MNSKLCEQCQLANKKLHLITSIDFENIKNSAVYSIKKKNILRNISISSFSISTALLYNVINYGLLLINHPIELNNLEAIVITLLFICSVIIGIISSFLYIGNNKATKNSSNKYSLLVDNIQSVQDKSEINLSYCKCIVGTWKMISNTFQSSKYTTAEVNIFPDSFGFKFNGPLIGDNNRSIAEVNSEICQYFPKEGTFKAIYEMIVNDKEKKDVKEKSSFRVHFLEDGKTLKGSWGTLEAIPFRNGEITLEKMV